MQKITNTIGFYLKMLGIFFVKLYQFILRPLFPSSCRFQPTCSEYTIQAIQKYGIFKGIYLGSKRISRCHGGNIGGVDELL